MKKINTKIIPSFIISAVLSLAALLFGVVGTAEAQGGGLGVSPSRFTIEHMIKHIDYEKDFVLSRSGNTEANIFRIEADDEIKDWVTTDRGDEFTLEADDSDGRLPITIIVRAPDHAPNGNYSGSIRIINTNAPSTDSGKTAGAGATINLAVAIKADFTLTDEQVLDYEVHSILVPHQVEKDSPLEIAAHIENRGNVMARPTLVKVEYYDQLNEKFLSSVNITDLSSVEPFVEDGEIIIEAAQTLDIGNYWAHVLVYRDEELLKEEDVTFEVVEVGTFAKQGQLLSVNHEQNILPEEVLEITGVFSNTGESNLAAKLMVEVYSQGNLIKSLKGDSRSVKVGETEELVAFFTPSSEGEYKLVSKVEYSGQETPTIETTVNVGVVAAVAQAIPANILLVVVISVVVAIIVTTTVVLIMNRRRGDRSGGVNQTQVPTTKKTQ